MKAFLREFLIILVLAAAIFIVAHNTIQTYVVIMTSMEPSFHEGQRVVVNKIVYIFGEPHRGDVVVFKAPNGQQDDFIKRVIALPGDTIEIKDGAVYVNGTRLSEPYIKSSPAYSMAKLEVPKGNYFVLGDNRNNSNDSHRGWLLPRENIIGKAWLSTWPPTAWGIVPNFPLGEQLAASNT